MTDDNLLRLIERIRTLHRRNLKVKEFRIAAEKEVQKIIDEAVDHVIKLLKENHTHEKYPQLKQYFAQKGQQLLGHVINIRRAYETAINVIDHPQHLPLILDLFRKQPANVRKDFQNVIQTTTHVFQIVREDVWHVILPNARSQEAVLRAFVESNSLPYFIQFVELYRDGQAAVKHLDRRLHPHITATVEHANRLIALMKKPIDWEEHHKKAFAAADLGIMAAGALLVVLAGPEIGIGALILGAVHKGVQIGELGFKILTIEQEVDKLAA